MFCRLSKGSVSNELSPGRPMRSICVPMAGGGRPFSSPVPPAPLQPASGARPAARKRIRVDGLIVSSVLLARTCGRVAFGRIVVSRPAYEPHGACPVELHRDDQVARQP